MKPKITPAYLVYHSNPASDATRTFFTNENLLTARKAAFTFVESLFANRLEDFLGHDELEVYLVETAQPDDSAPCVIAQVMRKIEGDPDSDEYRNAHQRKLLELHREFSYYQIHHHSIGFGAFDILVCRQHQPDQPQRLIVLSEAVSSVMSTISSHNSGWNIHFDFEYYYPDEPIEERQLS